MLATGAGPDEFMTSYPTPCPCPWRWRCEGRHRTRCGGSRRPKPRMMMITPNKRSLEGGPCGPGFDVNTVPARIPSRNPGDRLAARDRGRPGDASERWQRHRRRGGRRLRAGGLRAERLGARGPGDPAPPPGRRRGDRPGRSFAGPGRRVARHRRPGPAASWPPRLHDPVDASDARRRPRPLRPAAVVPCAGACRSPGRRRLSDHFLAAPAGSLVCESPGRVAGNRSLVPEAGGALLRRRDVSPAGAWRRRSAAWPRRGPPTSTRVRSPARSSRIWTATAGS